MTDQADLAALIGSRICHDLISPIGAIGNGVELLMMGAGAKSPEIALIADSVTHANARIRFFRVAFGAATEGQRIGAPEVSGVLADMTRGGRLALGWEGPADLARAEVKLAFLGILCLESAMPYGGRVAVSATAGWRIGGEAARLRIDDTLWGPLGRGETPPAGNPALVHFVLLAEEAARHGRQLRVSMAGDRLDIAF